MYYIIKLLKNYVTNAPKPRHHSVLSLFPCSLTWHWKTPRNYKTGVIVIMNLKRFTNINFVLFKITLKLKLLRWRRGPESDASLDASHVFWPGNKYFRINCHISWFCLYRIKTGYSIEKQRSAPMWDCQHPKLYFFYIYFYKSPFKI